MNVFSRLFYIVFMILAALPNIYLVVSMPVVLAWKVYRKIKHGIKLTD